MRPTQQILEAIDRARGEGRLTERPHAPPAPAAPRPRESEADFQARVIALAHAHGWRVAHFRKARTKRGWRTPVSADGKGFPDLLMIHEVRGLILVAELKSATGKTTEDQDEWLLAFQLAGVPSYQWRPGDWDEITKALGGNAGETPSGMAGGPADE